MKHLLLLVALAACGGSLASHRTHRVAYPSGLARFEFELRDGLPNGRGRTFYPDGTLALEGTYSDGARDGRFWFYTETGSLAYQAIYLDNAEVWRSTRPDEEPPAEWTKELPTASNDAPTPRRAERVEPVRADRWLARSTVPEPYFSALDRTTLDRGGAQLGVGESEDTDFGSVVRLDVFGHYRLARFGVYGQLSQTQLAAPASSLSGRRTLELGGTRRFGISVGTFTGRVGLLAPIGNDDTDGFVASTAGVMQRPGDAASSFASSLAARTSASFVRTGERSVLQVDAGVDWLLGTETRPVDALARANAGVGLGTRTAMVTLELSNTLRIAELRTLNSLAIAGNFAIAKLSFGAGISFSIQGTTTLLTSVGYDL